MRWTRAVAGIALAFPAAAFNAEASAGPAGWTVTVLPVDQRHPSSYSEPGITAAADGTLLANACTANAGGPSTYWRSRDDGRTWSHGFPIGESAIGCGDSDAAIGSDGWEYALTLGTGVSVYRSRDGRDWKGPAAFPPPHGEDQPDRPWLVLDPKHPATVLMFNSEVGGNIVVWRSDDHARTFTGPTPVTGGGNSEAALTIGSRPLVDPTDPSRMYLFYETVGKAGLAQAATDGGPSEFPFSDLWEARSDDGGRSWTNAPVLDVTSSFDVSSGSLGHLLPATAIDEAGNRYVVLSVRLGDDPETHLYLVRSTADGWTTPRRIDPPSPTRGSNVFPALAIRPDGERVVSWYSSPARDFSDPTAKWFETVAVGNHAPVRLSATPVHVGAIDNLGAVGNDVGQDWALRDFQSVTVDRCGRPHVVWAADHGTPRTYTATTAPPC